MTGAMIEDSRVQTLIERAQGGDRSAFDELVRAYEGRLRTVVHRQLGRGGAESDVDEVVQETFVLAFGAIERFRWRGEGGFFSWIARIARNVVIDQAKHSRRSAHLQLPDRLPADGPSPSQALRRDERFSRLECAIGELPPDYREVLRLSVLERLQVKEIARRMNRSEYAVKHLMARATRKLRASFGDTESLHLPDRPLDLEGGDHGET